MGSIGHRACEINGGWRLRWLDRAVFMAMLRRMQFGQQLVFGTLVRRYKRFLADVQLADGSTITAVCPNTGSMRSCQAPGWRVALSQSDSATRKYRYTLEIVHNGVCWIGINTARTNRIAEEAIATGGVAELAGYAEILREKRYGLNSRIDLLLKRPGQDCYVEVKNVTLRTDDGALAFPDAVTERGRKHLEELTRMVQAGHRAVMLFVAQRSDGAAFRIAAEIDPAYADAFREALAAGVEAIAYAAEVTTEGVSLARRLPITVT